MYSEHSESNQTASYRRSLKYFVLLSEQMIFSETYWIEKLKEEDSDEYYYDDY